MIRFITFEANFLEPDDDEATERQALALASTLAATLGERGWACTTPTRRASWGSEFVASQARLQASCTLHLADAWYLGCGTSMPWFGRKRRADADRLFRALCSDIEAALDVQEGISKVAGWMTEEEFQRREQDAGSRR